MAETGSPLVRGTLFVYSSDRHEWIPWERPPQPPGYVWTWPNAGQRSLRALTWNVSCDPAYAVPRAHYLLSQFTAVSPDVAGLQEVSVCSEDDAGAPGYKGRGFWDVLIEHSFIRREYVITSLEEQNNRMFEGDAPFGSVLLLRRSLIASVPQVWLWYCHMESRDYSNLVGADLCDQAGRPWFSIAVGQFEADPPDPDASNRDAEYTRQSRAAQFRAVARPGGPLGRAVDGNALLLADLSIRALEEAQPFLDAGFVDVYRAARPTEDPRQGATFGGWGMQLVNTVPPGPNQRRRQDFILGRGKWLTGGTAELIGSQQIRQGYANETYVDAAGRLLRIWPSTHLGVSARLSVGPQEQAESSSQGRGKRARTH